MPLERRCKDKISRKRTNTASVVENRRGVSLRKIDDYVKHVFRELNKEADHLAILQAEGALNITIDGIKKHGGVERSTWLLGRDHLREALSVQHTSSTQSKTSLRHLFPIFDTGTSNKPG